MTSPSSTGYGVSERWGEWAGPPSREEYDADFSDRAYPRDTCGSFLVSLYKCPNGATAQAIVRALASKFRGRTTGWHIRQLGSSFQASVFDGVDIANLERDVVAFFDAHREKTTEIFTGHDRTYTVTVTAPPLEVGKILNELTDPDAATTGFSEFEDPLCATITCESRAVLTGVLSALPGWAVVTVTMAAR